MLPESIDMYVGRAAMTSITDIGVAIVAVIQRDTATI